MLRAERLTKILELVNQQKYVSAQNIIDLLGASRSTVLRDINDLSQEGRVKKTRGGIMMLETDTENPFEPSLAIRSHLYTKEKERIASKAMEYVAGCSSIMLDAGTTSMMFASALAKEVKTPLTVITHDLNIALELNANRNINVFLIGGNLQRNATTVGYYAEKMIGEFHVDRVFMGIDGISLTDGLQNYKTEDIGLKRKIVSGIGDEVIVICDHSKFNFHSLLKICDLSEVDRIITGKELSEEIAEPFRALGVDLELV